MAATQGTRVKVEEEEKKRVGRRKGVCCEHAWFGP